MFERGNVENWDCRRTYTWKRRRVRGVRLRAGKSFMETERPVQFLYPLELHCDREKKRDITLNPAAKEFRPKRKAAYDAKNNIQLIQDQEEDELYGLYWLCLTL